MYILGLSGQCEKVVVRKNVTLVENELQNDKWQLYQGHCHCTNREEALRWFF